MTVELGTAEISAREKRVVEMSDGKIIKVPLDKLSATDQILAKVHLRRMFGYSTDLRSATQGRASYSMQFEKYDAWE